MAVQAKITAKIIKSHAPGRKLIAHGGQEDIFIHCWALHSWLLRCYYERGKWKEERGVCLCCLLLFSLKRWRERQEWLLFALKHQELAGIRGIILGWMDTVWQHWCVRWIGEVGCISPRAHICYPSLVNVTPDGNQEGGFITHIKRTVCWQVMCFLPLSTCC